MSQLTELNVETLLVVLRGFSILLHWIDYSLVWLMNLFCVVTKLTHELWAILNFGIHSICFWRRVRQVIILSSEINVKVLILQRYPFKHGVTNTQVKWCPSTSTKWQYNSTAYDAGHTKIDKKQCKEQKRKILIESFEKSWAGIKFWLRDRDASKGKNIVIQWCKYILTIHV